ncbi:MAG: hypothetical protein V1672_03795 [Candidatus Diapherotrites archaeon]
MAAVEALKFSQKYPFSRTAKNVLREMNLSLEEVPIETIKRAKVMIELAAIGKEYEVEEINHSELLKNEILAFPVAKILLSFLNKSSLNEKFAMMVSKTTFNYLSKEKNRNEILLNLADDLDLKFSLSNDENFFVTLDLFDYLKINFNEDYLKLVNQKVKAGKVYVDENDFMRFISELVFTRIYDSLPADINNVPSKFKTMSRELALDVIASQKRYTEFKFTGKIKPEYFPPCVSEIYDSILEGKNISHSARFFLATFLAGIEMPSSEIIEIFKKAPNYKESTTKYQVERIAGKKGTKYTPPSCVKIKEYTLCNSKTCNVKHPLSYYKRELAKEKKNKQKKNEKQTKDA